MGHAAVLLTHYRASDNWTKNARHVPLRLPKTITSCFSFLKKEDLLKIKIELSEKLFVLNAS